MNNLKTIWNFFASVKLAIFTLCSLAVTSIIGTIIPQGKSASFYIEQYGAATAQFMQVLDIPDMYYSWWFILLLSLLSLNLIVCSLERFPKVLKIIHADNFQVSPERIGKMTSAKEWVLSSGETKDFDTGSLLKSVGMKAVGSKVEGGVLYFSQSGKYSRTGVYLVHLSILVIFIGAIVGAILGFKGSVLIPELKETDRIFSSEDSSTIDLGFTVRCDEFIIEFYDNGMPKEYQSTLTILEEEKELFTTDIEVNGPLTYKGITFYQSSYQGYQDFIINVTDSKTGKTSQAMLPFQKQQNLDGFNLRYGIINAEALGQRVTRTKLWIKHGDNPAVITWLEDNKPTVINIENNNYTVTVKQMYATGLQVAKDPGVWIVYLGCGLMLLGLYMAFFLSHRRIWLFHDTTPEKQKIILGGSSNKNKIAFKQLFAKLENRIDKLIQQ